MKKNGFSLAELMITLGIIGVVSALTIPTLVSSNTNAQIGPKLAKGVASFEQGVQSMLNDNRVDTVVDAGLFGNANFMSELSKYIKIQNTSVGWQSKDGISYNLTFKAAAPANTTEPPHKQIIADLTMDINGDGKPNALAGDQFMFEVYNDGSLVPYGTASGDTNWTTTCPKDGKPTNSSYCAAHIFENNLKVLYHLD